MATLDIFGNNAFSMSNLTNAINLAPYKPGLLGELGLFRQIPIRTLTAWIERKHKKLRVLRTANRGTVMDVHAMTPRDALPFKVPHVPYFGQILADDIQGIRAFGTESELETMADHVNEKLADMRDDHEVTHEFHRIGALKGIIYDADMTEIYNLFTAFGISQTVSSWYQNDANLASHYTSIIRTIAGKLGANNLTGLIALCGDTYFDKLTSHATTYAAYDRWRDGEFKRMSYLGPQWYAAAANGFSLQNILFINYRGEIGDLEFIEDNAAYFVPQGVRDLFQEVIAPADTMETVNTKGRKFYAFQERIKYNKGVELHTQSNVLAMCTRPDVILKDVWNDGTNPSSSSA